MVVFKLNPWVKKWQKKLSFQNQCDNLNWNKLKCILIFKNKVVRLNKRRFPKIPHWIDSYRVNRFNVVPVNRFRTNLNRFTIMLMNRFSTELNRISWVGMNRFIIEMNRFNQSVSMFSWQTTYMHYSLHMSQLGD